jgi:NAD-dependent dihydropyrimidine dehydrogenase PreA subunit
MIPAITIDDCTGCYACVDACELQCLAIEGGVAVVSAPERCDQHEHCIESCPTNAMRMEMQAVAI